MEMKKIIVDIDNTLWDLSLELWEHLKTINPHVPPPSRWNHWDFWKGYLPRRDLFRVLRKIHILMKRFSEI